MRKLMKAVLSTLIALQVGFFLPMQQARADIVSDVIKLISEAAGWPAELPPVDALLALVDVAQKCTDDSSMDGLIHCVEVADANPDIHNKLGDNLEKINYGLELFQDITTGNYLGVLEKLGATIGCAAAVMITGVPVCAMADLIAGIGGAIYDAAKEIYDFLESVGAHAVVKPQDYYGMHWYPKVSLGLQISVFFEGLSSLPKNFGDLTGPMYDVCYDFYKKNQDKTEGAATSICSNLQQQFVNEVNSEVTKLENSAKNLIIAAYDVKSVDWRIEWEPKCNLTSGVVQNSEGLIAACKDKVAVEIAKGRPIAGSKVKFCRVVDTLTYDIQQCVKYGYTDKDVQKALLAAVAANQKLQSDFDNNPNNATTVLAKLAWQETQFKKEVGAWLAQCKNNSLNTPCRDALRQAWTACNAQIAKVPTTTDLALQDPEKLQKAKSQCVVSYNALVTAYAKFGDKQDAMASLSTSCPKNGQGSGPLFTAAIAQCSKDVGTATLKCTGGLPQVTPAFYGSGKLAQTPPGLDDCSSEVNFFKSKWDVDEQIRGNLLAAAFSANNGCTASGLPGCASAIVAKADECKAKITKQANEVVGPIPTVPAYQADLAKALADLVAAGSNCVKEVLQVPADYLKSHQDDALALQIYSKQCPPSFGTLDYAQLCKTEILKTINDCTRFSTNTSVRPGGSVAEQQVADCKPKLQAVIDKYQKQYSAFVNPVKAAATPSAATQTQGVVNANVTALPAGPSGPTPVKAAGASLGAVPGVGPSTGTLPAAGKVMAEMPVGVLAVSASPTPTKPGNSDPVHYAQQRKPLLEAPWLSRCASNACRTEVVRLIGNRIADEFNALGTRVNPGDAKAIDALYGELDHKFREPLNLALKKSDAAPATRPGIVAPR